MTLGGLVTLAIGILLVCRLTGATVREGKSQLLTTLCLGLAVGLVLTSCAHFLWQEVFSTAPRTFPLVDVGLLLAVGLPWTLGRAGGTAPAGQANTFGPGQPRVAALLMAAVVLAVALDGGAFVFEQLTGSAVQWDTVAIWNLKARFLLRAGPHWSDAIDPALVTSHPDYPLLLPLTVARLWRYTGGGESSVVPIATAAVFTAASVALLGAAVTQLRGRAQGCLAALALLAMSAFIEIGAWQYADVPMAFFQLAAIVCTMLALRQERERRPLSDPAAGTWAVAGLCAGAALWTKNEGTLFAAAFLVAIVALGPVSKEGRTLRRVSYVGLGLLPAIAALVSFKLMHPFPNDFLAGFDRETARRLFNPERHTTILSSLRAAALSFPDRGPTLLLLAYASVAATQIGRSTFSLGASEHTALAASTLCLVLVSVGLYSTYLITPYPLAWHVSSSAPRLGLQFLPSVLFLMFVALPPAENVLGRAPRSIR
jgi:hypothetical protein